MEARFKTSLKFADGESLKKMENRKKICCVV